MKGRAVIQTYQPEDSTIQMAKTHDYEAFYNNEIKIRKQLSYPPFSQIISILVSGMDENAVKRRIGRIAVELKEKIKGSHCSAAWGELLGPMPAPISRIKNKHRWRILLKCEDSENIGGILANMLSEHYNDRNNIGVSLIIDINPVNMY
jgi:primosomal protein N' (replication factor Y)